MNFSFLYYSSFSYIFFACFKLGLYQYDSAGIVFQKSVNIGKYLFKRNKRYVHAYKVRLSARILLGYAAYIGIFHIYYTAVISEFFGELTCADIYCIDSFSTVYEHIFGETAR